MAIIKTLISEVYVDVTYVTKPIVAPSTTGTITDTNKPLIQWVNTLDSDGGQQTKYEVKIFSAAQYGAGGFDPATSTPTYTSGEVNSSLLYHQAPVLSNDSFRAYVRIAQTVNTVIHRSDWAYSSFTIAYVEPSVISSSLYTSQVTPSWTVKQKQAPLSLDFSWNGTTTYPSWSFYGVQYPPLHQIDGLTRSTDANYSAVATGNNQNVDFTAAVTMPSGLSVIEYKWDFGDGQVGYGSVARHFYRVSSPETRVSLTITDSNGNTWSRSKLLALVFATPTVVHGFQVRNP